MKTDTRDLTVPQTNKGKYRINLPISLDDAEFSKITVRWHFPLASLARSSRRYEVPLSSFAPSTFYSVSLRNEGESGFRVAEEPNTTAKLLFEAAISDSARIDYGRCFVQLATQ